MSVKELIEYTTNGYNNLQLIYLIKFYLVLRDNFQQKQY
jgi:hypothetical protein